MRKVENVKIQFDTRAIKSKLYHLIILAVLTVITQLVLLSGEDPARQRGAVIILVLYFLAMIICLWDAFFKQLQYNPYSYNTIIYAGFGLFCVFLLVTHVYLTVQSFTDPQGMLREHILYVLYNSAKNYMLITAPFLVVFSVLLFISNISLIRHEGRRFVNLLGILLSVFLVAGEILVFALDRYLGGSTLLTNLIAVLYLYFECMIIGTIIADSIAAKYVPERNKDFLIVLGCGIRKDGTPTPLLRGRVDLARKFRERQMRETGKQAVFVLSGGQGPNEVQSEAASMRDYLIAQGVAQEDIIVEDQSESTAENMRYSKEKIDAVNPDGKVAYFTTNYHVFRAGLKARRVKMRAQGMGAKTKWYFWPNAAVREFVGLITEHRLKQGLLLGGLLLGYVLLSFFNAGYL